MRGEFLPVTKQGGEGVKMGRKPSKTAGLIAANSTQKSMSNAQKSVSNAVVSGKFSKRQ